MTGQEQTNEITGTEAEKIEPVAIYQNQIYALVDDVKELEQFKGLSDTELKNNKSFFPTLIDYIYINYIGDLLGNKHGKQIIYKDIYQIDTLFYIYIDLVNKYKWNDKPFIVEFSTFTGINKNTFYNWLKGNNEGYTDGEQNGGTLTSERSDTVAKWVSICERALLNGSSSDQIRDIFILKAKHGYKDNNNEVNITVNHKQIISADTLPSLIETQ